MTRKVKLSSCQKFIMGISLIEVLLVVGILAIALTFTLPIGLDFYESYQLDIQAREVVQALRRAQLKAMAIDNDANFGVHLTDDEYTLFKGDSYLAREAQHDEVFDLPIIITISGIREVVFSKFEGSASVVGDIIISNNGNTRTIDINRIGRISLE